MEEQRTDGRVGKAVVAEDCERALERMVAKVNDGFRGGRIGRQELAAWIVCWFEREGFEAAVEEIRADHFDEVTYLDSVLRELKAARRDGDGGADVAALLAPLVPRPGAQKPVRAPRIRTQTSTAHPSVAPSLGEQGS